MLFKRKIYDKMLQWKQESNGQSALLIEGARRIGKSTVVEEFAKKEYKSYILIDFSNTTVEVKELFDYIFNLNYIFLQLQFIYDIVLYERESVIIFDEVQLCPKARQAIKSLVKDGRYDYIETGSLISIHKNVKDILIPSEEKKIAMYPMDYEEFLLATGNTTTVPLLKQLYDEKNGVGEKLNRIMMRDFRLYMLIGGMPQAVNTYIETNNFRLVDDIKRSILDLYEEDFRKVDPTGNISMIFDAIPSQLHKNSSRFQIKDALNNKRISENNKLNLIAELVDSKTVLATYHVNDPMVGLSGFKDLNKFKLYLTDTGLFVTLTFKDRDFMENDIYSNSSFALQFQ
ncbi:MAG: AAA family ATPase [Erysipelotrichaceae bacterium]|nr:AAA family ATPase [Erysipelotrichaceae bacterium]